MTDAIPQMAVRRSGSGPDLVLFPAHFTVHALDHPSYDLFVEMFPADAPLRLAGFSFGGAIAANLARRLAPRVTHLCLVSPGGFPRRRFGDRPSRSYRDAGDDEKLCRRSV